jgi:hypothetical protein
VAEVRAIAIVSTGRTGTTFLAQLFNRPDLGIISKHEPAPTLADLGADFVKGKKPVAEVQQTILRHRKQILKRAKGNIYLESNGCLILLLPALKALIKNLKVIHIVRNPIDFVRSGVNRAFWRHGELVQTYAEEARWQLRATDFPDSQEDWSSLDIYERFMWTWHFKNERGQRFVSENPDCGLTVRFEDIFLSKSRQGFRSILNFLGLSHYASEFDPREFTKVISPSIASLAEPFEAWPVRRKNSLQRICGSLARTWGYDLSSDKLDEEIDAQILEHGGQPGQM